MIPAIDQARYSQAAAIALFALTVAANVAHADDEGIKEIHSNADTLKQTLESMPYASEGSGPAIYTFEFSECPYCQLMHKEWSGKTEGIEMRRMFYAVSPRSANEMAALARTRDINDYKAYMEGRKQAPTVDDKRLPPAEYNKNVALFNSIITPLDQTVEPILRQNGVISGNLVSPMLIWEEKGKWYASAGYQKPRFANILERLKAGGANEPAPEVTAASRAALVEPESTSSSSDEPILEIVGLKLGMTMEQALAALRAHNPAFQLSTLSTDVTIADSNRQPLKVTSYDKELRAAWRQGVKGYTPGALFQEQIVAVFAPPPADHRVQYVRRVLRYQPGQGPAFDGVRASITEKYGKAPYIAGKQGSSVTQFWYDGGSDGKRLAEPPFTIAYRRLRVNLGNDLRQPGTEGAPAITNSRHLGVLLVPNGHGLYMMGALLSESKETTEERNEATRVMANAALEAHEAKLRGEAAKRQGPAL